MLALLISNGFYLFLFDLFLIVHDCLFVNPLLCYFASELLYSFQVTDVKKNIENVQGVSVYPAAQQMLIHQGKVLKDDTTMEENKVVENSFIVIMLSKVKLSCS